MLCQDDATLNRSIQNKLFCIGVNNSSVRSQKQPETVTKLSWCVLASYRVNYRTVR